jgi:sortase (surface protein transpeptidase)
VKPEAPGGQSGPLPGGRGTAVSTGKASPALGAPGTLGTARASETFETDEAHGSTWIFETFGIFKTVDTPGIPGTNGDSRHARPGRPRIRLPRRPWALAVLTGGLIAAIIGVVGLVTPKARPAEIPRPAGQLAPVPSGAAVAVPGPSAVQPAALPVALTIPAIGVRTKLTRLGVTAQGTLQVPSSTSVAGWYTGSPRPGDIGSSIIAGHIDSYLGPGVFFRLRLLHPGDLVYVREANGKLAVFRVNSVVMYSKSKFPTATVYGPAPDAELRLITCGGVFDQATGSYLSNVVAYTTEVSQPPPPEPKSAPGSS